MTTHVDTDSQTCECIYILSIYIYSIYIHTLVYILSQEIYTSVFMNSFKETILSSSLPFFQVLKSMDF